MPRKRDGIIYESLENLLRREAEYRGKPEAVRIRMLRLLKEQPERQIEEVAALVGYSQASVKRWLKTYRACGLDGLILKGVGGKGAERIDGGMNLLKQKLLEGDFEGLGDVKHWIDTIEIPGGRRADRHLGSRVNGARALKAHTRQDDSGQAQAVVQEDTGDGIAERILDRVLPLLAPLAASPDVPEWAGVLRSGLVELLGDVDHINMTMNIHCPLDNPTGYRPTVAIMQRGGEEIQSLTPIPEDQVEEAADYPRRFIEYLRSKQFPFEMYHPPHVYMYLHGGSAYLGTLVLWRDRSKPAISERTLKVMERLEPFFTFIFSDFVARRNANRPLDRLVTMALGELIDVSALTIQEQRIITLQVIGLTYHDIARTLNISVNTVRSHIKSIYKKTGTHSKTDFFKKYFTPLMNPAKSR